MKAPYHKKRHPWRNQDLRSPDKRTEARPSPPPEHSDFELTSAHLNLADSRAAVKLLREETEGAKSRRRVDVAAILRDPFRKRELMIGVIVATQARAGITTTRTEAEEAYDKIHGTKVDSRSRCAGKCRHQWCAGYDAGYSDGQDDERDHLLTLK